MPQTTIWHNDGKIMMKPFVLGRHRVQEEALLSRGYQVVPWGGPPRTRSSFALVLGDFLDRNHLWLRSSLSSVGKVASICCPSGWISPKMSSMVISGSSETNGFLVPVTRRSVISSSSSHSCARERVAPTSVVEIADPSPACKDQHHDF